MDTKKKRIQDTIAELLEEADAKQESKTTRMAMKTLGVALLKKLNEVIKTVQSNKVVFPSKTNVTVTNAKDFPKPVVNVPSEVSLRQVAWLQNAFESIKDEVKKITGQALKFPKTAKDAIPVRLSDGEEFYKAVADVVVQGGGMSGGGGSVPKITLDGGIQAVPVVNPDGTNIAGGEGGGSGVAAYSDSSDTDKKGLVDADRHVQVDVLTAPTTTVQATDLDIRDLTSTDVVTAELSATDNAVLDTIDAVLDTIKVDTEAIETAVEAIQSGQLADGHNVTIDNASGASAVNIQDGGNTITVDGTVTANLSGTDNTVLDNIDSDTSNIQTAVQLIDDAIVADDAAFTPATTKVMMSGFEFDDTTPDSVNEGDAGAARMSSRREVYVQVRDAAGNERGLNVDASGRITTNATQGGTWNIGTVTAVTAISNALPAGNNNIGDVDVASVIPGTGATSLGKAGDGTSGSTDTGVAVFGLRHDTPNDALAGTDYDYTFLSLYKTGAIRTAIPEEDFAALGSNHVKKYYTNAGAVTDGIVWSPAAGKRWYITDISINVSAAATVTLEDDLGAGDSAVWKAELAANGGWSHSFATPLFSGEDAADLIITTSAGNVYVTVTGYEI